MKGYTGEARDSGVSCIRSPGFEPSERVHHSTVKDLDKLYMAEQLRRHPWPSTWTIGVDEIAIRKGHEYWVVVSDLKRQWPI